MNIIILYLTATAAAVASTNSTCASIKGYVLGMGSDIGTKSNIPDVGACCTDCQNNVRLVFLLLLHRDTCNLSSPTQRYARPPSFPDFRGIPILFLFPLSFHILQLSSCTRVVRASARRGLTTRTPSSAGCTGLPMGGMHAMTRPFPACLMDRCRQHHPLQLQWESLQDPMRALLVRTEQSKYQPPTRPPAHQPAHTHAHSTDGVGDGVLVEKGLVSTQLFPLFSYQLPFPNIHHSLHCFCSRFKFCDASLSVDARVAALVEQVELDEIAEQLTARYVSHTPYHTKTSKQIQRMRAHPPTRTHSHVRARTHPH